MALGRAAGPRQNQKIRCKGRSRAGELRSRGAGKQRSKRPFARSGRGAKIAGNRVRAGPLLLLGGGRGPSAPLPSAPLPLCAPLCPSPPLPLCPSPPALLPAPLPFTGARSPVSGLWVYCSVRGGMRSRSGSHGRIRGDRPRNTTTWWVRVRDNEQTSQRMITKSDLAAQRLAARLLECPSWRSRCSPPESSPRRRRRSPRSELSTRQLARSRTIAPRTRPGLG